MAQGKTLERSETISIRVTPEEKSKIYEAAKLAGMTVTGYLVGYTIGDKLGEVIVNAYDKRKKKS